MVNQKGGKNNIFTFFTDDTYEVGSHNASSNFPHTNGRGRGINNDTNLIDSGIIPKDDIKINSFIIPMPHPDKIASWFNEHHGVDRKVDSLFKFQ